MSGVDSWTSWIDFGESLIGTGNATKLNSGGEVFVRSAKARLAVLGSLEFVSVPIPPPSRLFLQAKMNEIVTSKRCHCTAGGIAARLSTLAAPFEPFQLDLVM